MHFNYRRISCFFVLCWVPGIAAAAEPLQLHRTFQDMVGLNVKFGQGTPQSDLPLLQQLGVRWVRDSVLWATMEQIPGKYRPFPGDFLARLDFYKKNNIGIVFTLCYENPKAYPNTADNPHHSLDADAYGRYAAYIAKLLKTSGVQFILELWNEPHNNMAGLPGNFTGKPPSPWLDQYINMVNAAVKGVKALDPEVKIIDDEDMWVNHYWFLEKGLPAALDGFAVHPYVKAWPEITGVAQDTDWTAPFVVVDADCSMASAVRRLRDRGTMKMGKTPAIWITEWGWPLDGDVGWRKATEDIVAGMLPRAYITAAGAGVETVCWFSMQDSVDGPMGLLRNDGFQRAPFKAMQTMVAELGPYTSIAHVGGADHPTSGIQAYRFGGSVADKLAVWNIDGNSAAVLNGQGDAPIRITNTLGNLVEDERAPDGRLQISVGRSPLYIFGISPNVSVEPVTEKGVPAKFLFP
jgi:hypothetical protein